MLVLQTDKSTAHNSSFTPRYSHFTVFLGLYRAFWPFFSVFVATFRILGQKLPPPLPRLLFFSSIFEFSMETRFERVVICRGEMHSTSRSDWPIFQFLAIFRAFWPVFSALGAIFRVLCPNLTPPPSFLFFYSIFEFISVIRA